MWASMEQATKCRQSPHHHAAPFVAEAARRVRAGTGFGDVPGGAWRSSSASAAGKATLAEKSDVTELADLEDEKTLTTVSARLRTSHTRRGLSNGTDERQNTSTTRFQTCPATAGQAARLLHYKWCKARWNMLQRRCDRWSRSDCR